MPNGIPAPETQLRDRYLTHEEAERLLDELAKRDHSTYQMAYFALWTGCRKSECEKLTGDMVDLERGIITIPRVKHSKKTASRTVLFTLTSGPCWKGWTCRLASPC